MNSPERHLDLPASWQRAIIADEHPRRAVAHLFPAQYNTAFCGYNVEHASRGFQFSRETAEDADKRCATCRRVAVRSRFNTDDAELPPESR